MCGYGKGRSGRSLPRRESLLSAGARDGAKRDARWWHLLSPLSKRICPHREHAPGAAPQSAPSPLLTPIAKDFLSRQGRGRRPVPKRDSAAFTSHADENVSQRRARAVEKQGSGSSEEYSCSCLTDAEVRRPGVRTHVSSGKSRRQWGRGAPPSHPLSHTIFIGHESGPSQGQRSQVWSRSSRYLHRTANPEHFVAVVMSAGCRTSNGGPGGVDKGRMHGRLEGGGA